ncbi:MULTISPECIES: DUF998 domain-containing protein [unclassified Amycolatopsis]|uniref:DUF998 domain-containing protein n=1 Tax=unclassified Amycolatopsis TaxID=2618356 RepID=UPI002874AE8D|nr:MULTISPECIES: DUF998 domain-containing protein [unclassified Amycolatopsis]MDS0136053.1 DUF998 domain-containing protein [Amycolatopsis sp. 505]MDS0145358.1 DUF998 domain-containing protein [Amycolatopsis sp. CM201R]
MTPIVRSGAAARVGAVLLLAGPLVSWAAELVTASAWQEPHYSPFYNWVSQLGLTGPSQVAFGQVGNSPLGAVMDVGWVSYGILLIAGALLTFDLRRGPRPILIVVPAILAGVGVSLVGAFQGSNANVANGLIVFHTYGAQGVMLAGNLMAIAVGISATRIGLGRGRRIASIALGVFGLIAFAAFMADVFTGWAWNIGLFERAVIYPIMIGHVVLGSGLIAARTVRARRPWLRQPIPAGR